MSIETFEESPWESSVVRFALRRSVIVVALATVLAGPFVVGGTLGWMFTREAGPTLGDDGWVRARPQVAGAALGSPLVSTAELSAAGVSVDDARRLLRR